jgi:hypothetical protein
MRYFGIAPANQRARAAAPATVPLSSGLRALTNLLACLVLASSLVAAASPADEPNGVPQNPNLIPAQYILMEFRDSGFRVVEVTALEVVISPSQPLPAELGKVSGFWFELQSEEGGVRYRGIVDHPLLVRSEPPDDTAESVTVAVQALFSMVIPRVRPGEDLVIFSSPLEPGETGRPAREILRLPSSVLF